MKKLLVIIAIIILLISFKSEALSQAPALQYRIEIDIPSRSLYYIENDNILKEYPVAVGKANSQTPIGDFKVINKVVDPYYSKHKIAGGSPQNPLGSRWIGFKPSYGIHGNNNPKSIGTYVSAGCVRMYDKDVKELYEKVKVGVPVSVKYELIKIERDMDNINPIVTVYPDYYFKIPNLAKIVDEKLTELDLINKIDSNKLKELKKLINKEIVVFSDKWAYLINGNYITNDVISIDNVLYVNIDKICKFFNVDIYNTEIAETLTIFNNSISIVENNGSRYVPINMLEANFGGKHKLNHSQQVIKYDFNYLLFNNKLVKGEVVGIEGDAAISLDGLSSIFDTGTNTLQTVINVIGNNKSKSYRTVNGKSYISLKDFLMETGFKSNTYTKNKFIEIFGESNINYNDIYYKGKIDTGELLFPKELLIKISSEYQVNAEDYCGCFNVIKSLLEENEKYFNIKRLPGCFEVLKDYYNTEALIKGKTCDQN